MKKLFLVLLIITISSTITFVSFSNGQGEGGDVPTLKVHFMGGPNDAKLVQDKMNAYLEEKYNIKVDIVYTAFGDFGAKSNLIVNTGEDYDIIFTASWINKYLPNVQKGAFLDITDYLKKKEFKPLYDAIYDGFWDGVKIDGKIYAVPTQKEFASMPTYLFNKRLIDETNFDYKSVKRLRDTEPFLASIKKNNPEIIPFFLGSGSFYKGAYDYPLGQGIPVLVDENDKVMFAYDKEDVLDYFVTARDFFVKGYINQDAATTNVGFREVDDFGLATVGGIPYIDTLISNEVGYELVAQDASAPIADTSSARGSMMAINSNSKYPKESLMLLQAINTDSTLHNMLNYGIEGVHYNKVSANTIEKTEKGKSDYSQVIFSLGNFFNTYLLKGDPENKWDVFQEINENATISKLMGFNVDISSFENELAAINNLVGQYESIIGTGSVDTVPTIKEYKKKLMEVGLQKIIDEVQQQSDEFLKK